MEDFLKDVCGIQYFKGTTRILKSNVTNYQKDLNYFSRKLRDRKLNPFYPLFEIPDYHKLNENVMSNNNRIKHSNTIEDIEHPKTKDVKKLIFDYFITSKSAATMAKLRKMSEQRHRVSFIDIEPTKSVSNDIDMSKTN